MRRQAIRYAAVVSLALVACAGEPDTDPSDTDSTDTDALDSGDMGDTDDAVVDTDLPIDPLPDARLRFAHAADAAAVSVWVQGSDQPLVSSLAVGQASAWLDVLSGTYTLELKAAGATASDAALLTIDGAEVAVGANLTAVAVGSAGSSDASAELRVVLAHGLIGGGAGAGVRLVHGVTDVDAAELTFGALGTLGEERVPLGRFGVQAPPFAELDADVAVSASVLVEGSRAASFTLPGLEDGSGWLVVAAGQAALHPRAVNSLRAYAFSDTGVGLTIFPDPGLYLLHAVADAGEVDVFDGDNLIAGDLNYRDLRSVWVPAGSTVLDGFPAGTGGVRPSEAPLFTSDPVDLFTRERYLLLARGHAGSTQRPPNVTAVRDTFSLTDPLGQARFVHAHIDLPSIDGGFVESFSNPSFVGPRIFTDVVFGRASVSTSNAGGPSPDVGVGSAGATVAQLTFPFSYVNGRRSLHVITGRLSAQPASEVWRIDTNVSPWMLTVRPVTPVGGN